MCSVYPFLKEFGSNRPNMCKYNQAMSAKKKTYLLVYQCEYIKSKSDQI